MFFFQNGDIDSKDPIFLSLPRSERIKVVQRCGPSKAPRGTFWPGGWRIGLFIFYFPESNQKSSPAAVSEGSPSSSPPRVSERLDFTRGELENNDFEIFSQSNVIKCSQEPWMEVPRKVEDRS